MVVRAWRPPHPNPSQPCPGLAQTPTCAVQPRALSLDLAGIMGWVHLNVEGAGRDLLDEGKAWSRWTRVASEKAPFVSSEAHCSCTGSAQSMAVDSFPPPPMTASQAAGLDLGAGVQVMAKSGGWDTWLANSTMMV